MQRPLTSQIVIDEFTKIIDSQDEKGFKKYGTTIDQANNKDYNWELMALEETADLQKYLIRRILQVSGELVRAKAENRKLENELNGYIDDIEQLEGMLAQANNRIEELESKQSTIFVDEDHQLFKKKLADFMQQINPKPTMEQIEQLKQQYFENRKRKDDE
ncbi:hypothetical protein [Bacillus sp. FJAT-29814]|uniref:hypothetical protein n=1 Tax=Bacillus sp. FJAT-29814 TaxID=1729688 RepID=UPI0008335049|nr:hypothetical protein [Bacillus sp. FJAT-29814]